jgi:hypothetical protein
MSLRTSLILICLISFLTCVRAQEKKPGPTRKVVVDLPPPKVDEDLIDMVRHRLHVHVPQKPRIKNRLNFSFIPVATTGTAGGNKVLVSSINVAFILGNPDSTKVSSVYFLPYTNFYHNFGFGTKPNIWTVNNNWNIPGEFRISRLAQYTYGLGSLSSTRDAVQLNYKNIRMYVTGNRKLFTNFFAGLGFQFDRYYGISQSGSSVSPSVFEKYGVGTGTTSFSSGLTFNILHDSRKNSINASDGLYYALIFRSNPAFMDNPSNWHSLYLDARKYFVIPSDKRKILALWGIYWGSYGNVPYLNLPGTQLELAGRSGRGFSQGRFRGKEMLYLESEYRFDISDNKFFGGVVFVNAQSYKEPATNRFQYVNPAAGIGARIKFNKQSDTNLTIDFAAGKDSFNFYIGLGEFF